MRSLSSEAALYRSVGNAYQYTRETHRTWFCRLQAGGRHLDGIQCFVHLLHGEPVVLGEDCDVPNLIQATRSSQ
jgi:hypothetical protein